MPIGPRNPRRTRHTNPKGESVSAATVPTSSVIGPKLFLALEIGDEDLRKRGHGSKTPNFG